MQTGLPRGVRNNNPGNIDRTTTNWFGMSEDQSGDPRFAVFERPEFGVRALAKTLLTYFRRHDLCNVHDIINRWAPPVENDSGAYVAHVAKRLGVEPHQGIDVEDVAILKPLTEAIIAHENGGYVYPAAVIDAGVQMALGRQQLPDLNPTA